MSDKIKFDIIVQEGLIADGTGGSLYKGDIGIISDRIINIGDLRDCECSERIDATGLIVSPGFIDVHTHTDKHSQFYPFAEGKVMQGVTTDICGLCGTSFAPIGKNGLSEYIKRNRDKLIEGIENPFRAISFQEFLEETNERGNATNLGMFVGNANLRLEFSKYENRELSDEEFVEMKEMLKLAMDEGAFGLSTGLTYVPSMYSSIEELIELCKVIAPYSGIYNSHMRNEGNEVLDSINELIRITRESGCNGHISHLKVLGKKNHGKSVQCIKLIDEANNSGQNVTFDVYPYTAGSTSLTTLLPEWVISLGFENDFEIFTKKRDLIESDLAKEDWDNIIASSGYENIYIGNSEGNPNYEGKNLKEIADELQILELDALFKVLKDSKGHATMIYHSIYEEDLIQFMKHPKCMIGTDAYSRHYSGPTAEGKPHPRNYGAFPRFIRRYIIDKGILTMTEGIHRITGLPAETFGLTDRGLIKKDYIADITIFNPDSIQDVGDYEKPNQVPKGIEWVLVNGDIVVKKGGFTGKASGRMLKFRKV